MSDTGLTDEYMTVTVRLDCTGGWSGSWIASSYSRTLSLSSTDFVLPQGPGHKELLHDHIVLHTVDKLILTSVPVLQIPSAPCQSEVLWTTHGKTVVLPYSNLFMLGTWA